MPNRSNWNLPELPVIYEQVRARYPGEPRRDPFLLTIYEPTFLHFHNLVELALCVEGEGICYVDGEAYPFQTGDVQIIFPYQQHLSKSIGDSPSRWYWLDVDGPVLLSRLGFTDVSAVDRLINEEMGLSGIIDGRKYPRICGLVRQMIREVYEPEQPRVNPMDYYGALFYMLLQELREASADMPKIAHSRDGLLKEVAPALMKIRNGVGSGELPEVGELPGLCGMSEASFRRKFKRAVGLPAKEYITACCIHRACHLLRSTGDKIIDISQTCGFMTVSGFNRSFMKYIGTSPRSYRNDREAL